MCLKSYQGIIFVWGKAEAGLNTICHHHPNDISICKFMNFTKRHLNFWLSKMSSNYIAVTQATACVPESRVPTIPHDSRPTWASHPGGHSACHIQISSGRCPQFVLCLKGH